MIRKIIALSLLLGTTAQAEVVYVVDNGFSVKNQVVINKSPKQTWNTLIGEVDNWWPKDHSWWGEQGKFVIDAKAGGCFCEISGDKSAEHMRILFVEPEKLLRMSGGLGPLQGMGMTGVLDWSFKAVDAGTEVTLTYIANGYTPNGYEKLAPIVGKVQGVQLNGLKSLLDNE